MSTPLITGRSGNTLDVEADVGGRVTVNTKLGSYRLVVQVDGSLVVNYLGKGPSSRLRIEPSANNEVIIHGN